MIVAIIDNGICEEEMITKIERYLIDGNLTQQTNRYSHATICAKLIESNAQIDKFIDIRILDNNGASNYDKLCKALRYCLTLLPDYINLSNGIECFSVGMYNELYGICQKLYNLGVKIFAAQSNSGRITIPADFDNVCSVEYKFPISNYIRRDYRKSNICLRTPSKVVFNNESHNIEKCNSFACAYTLCRKKFETANISQERENSKVGILSYLKYRIFSILYPRDTIPILKIIGKDSNLLILGLNEKLRESGYYVDVLHIDSLNDKFDFLKGKSIIISKFCGIDIILYSSNKKLIYIFTM